MTMWKSRHSSRNQLAALSLLLLCSFLAATESAILQTTSPLRRQLQNTGEAEDNDEGVIDAKDEAAVMTDDTLEAEYQFDDAALMEDHFDSKDFPEKADYNVPDNAPDDMMYALGGGGGGGGDVADRGDNKVPEVVYDDFGMNLGANQLPKDYDDTPVNPQPEEEPVEQVVPEIVHDGGYAIAPGDKMKPYNDRDTPDGEALKTYSDDQQRKWVAHGAIGTTIFGLLVPSAISSAFFRDFMRGYWIYIHIFLNVTTFALTFFTVGIAFATLNGMGDASEGHLKETHHIVGLLLLLLVSFQTANGFLRPSKEFITDDLNDRTPGAIHRSQTKSLTTRTLWYLSHAGCGLLIFALGTYQVHSGLGLFSKRFGTTDWSIVYLGYIFLVIIVIIGGKVARERSLRWTLVESGERRHPE